MFYAHFVLAKKGPLARIWLAAHWDKKLTKAHVFEINIEHSVEGILQPKVKMALRTSGHLLLGIVRIYSRKAKYLLADCNEAFIKIKMAFRPGVVDLPEGNREAAVATITLPEVFHDFDTAMPDITIDMDSQVTLNQCRAEDITIKEDYGNLSLINDGFDDFDEVEVVRDAANIDDGFNRDGFNFENPPNQPEDSLQDTSSIGMNQNVSLPSIKDNVVPSVADSLLDNDPGQIFETGGLFDEPIGQVSALDTNNIPDTVENEPGIAKSTVPQDDSDDDMYDVGPPSMGPPSLPSSPESPHETAEKQPEADVGFPDDLNNALTTELNDIGATTSASCSNNQNKGLSAINEMPPPPPALLTINQHPLGEGDSFALAPLDATIVQGTERTVKAKRKRKLIVDEVKNISGEEMKSQLSDTSDIVTSLDLAPPTKRLMHWKETGGVEKLFALPGHPILSRTLSRLYQRHLTTRSIDNEEASPISPEDDYEPARKKVCEMEPVLPPDLTNVNPAFERSYANESEIMHPGMDISSNIPTPQHPVFHLADQSQPQLMNSIMSPTHHMIHQMLPPDMSPLPHGSQMMQPPSVGIDPGSQLPALGPNMHEISPSGLAEFTQSVHPSVIESVPQHLISNFLPSAVEGQGQSVTENQISQSPVMDPQIHNHPSLDLVSNSKETESCITGQDLKINGSVNNDVPQPFSDNDLCFDKVMASSNIDQHLLNTENDELRINEQVQLPEIPFSTADNASMEDPLLEPDKEPGVQNVDTLSMVQRQPDQSDDDDDYGAPSSVGPVYPEEQMADETYEQFEERILTKRTTHMLHIIHSQLNNDKEVKLSELSRNNKRKQVAQKFYTLLVLKKQQAVELRQDGPYGDLVITTGPKFHAVYNAN